MEEKARARAFIVVSKGGWVRHGRQVWTSLGSWRRQCSIYGRARVHNPGCSWELPEGLLHLPAPGFHPQTLSLVWDFFVDVFF